MDVNEWNIYIYSDENDKNTKKKKNSQSVIHTWFIDSLIWDNLIEPVIAFLLWWAQADRTENTVKLLAQLKDRTISQYGLLLGTKDICCLSQQPWRRVMSIHFFEAWPVVKRIMITSAILRKRHSGVTVTKKRSSLTLSQHQFHWQLRVMDCKPLSTCHGKSPPLPPVRLHGSQVALLSTATEYTALTSRLDREQRGSFGPVETPKPSPPRSRILFLQLLRLLHPSKCLLSLVHPSPSSLFLWASLAVRRHTAQRHGSSHPYSVHCLSSKARSDPLMANDWRFHVNQVQILLLFLLVVLLKGSNNYNDHNEHSVIGPRLSHPLLFFTWHPRILPGSLSTRTCRIHQDFPFGISNLPVPGGRREKLGGEYRKGCWISVQEKKYQWK